MTDIDPTEANELEEADANAELLPDLYTECDTGLLYECRFFDKFVIVRPASPAFYLAIKKLSLDLFSEAFEPFTGSHEDAREMIRGGTPMFYIERA